MSSETEFLSAYERIKAIHVNIKRQIDEAISYEEQELLMEAIAAYERCITNIEETFAIPVGLPDDIDMVQAEWNDACTMIQKLKGMKPEIAYRLKVLRAQQAPVDEAAVEAAEGTAIYAPLSDKRFVLLENPSTYYDIRNASGTSKTYKEIISALREVIATRDCGVNFDTLFHTQAKLYGIQPNGVVTTIAGEAPMSLVMCTIGGGNWHFLNGICFIQCTLPQSFRPDTASQSSKAGNMIWIYPLVPNVTTCYRTAYKAFIFPDMESTENVGHAFGIILSDPSISGKTESVEEGSEEKSEELGDLQQFFLDLLEAILVASIQELTQPIAPQPDTSQVVSKNIVCAADFISRNLIKGAEKTGELMVKGTPYIISKMNPAAPDAPPVSSKVQTSVEVAKNVTSAAVGATSWIAGKVGAASMAVGRFLAPHIQSSGATLLEKGFGYDTNEANTKMEGAMTIAAGAVEGFSTVYNGLETSASILGTSLSQNSVKIVEHKYGPSAGDVAAGTFDTIGNAFIVSRNVNYITPKGIAKNMAKNTGKAVVDDYKRSLRTDSHVVPAGLLYPDLRCLKSGENLA